MLSLHAALSTFDASEALGTAARLAAGRLLAEAVREALEADDEESCLYTSHTTTFAPLATTTATRRLPIAITDHR
eukprot:6095214-Prymnesium_polylepis.1